MGFAIHFVSAALEISSAILDEIIKRGTITYSKYLKGFFVSIPLIFIAIFIFSLSSAKDGKNRNITAIGIDMALGIFKTSIDEIILPTSDVLIKNFPANKRYIKHTQYKKLKKITSLLKMATELIS